MDHYPKYVLAAGCAAAAVMAYVLALSIPANFAAMIGGTFGIAAVQKLDEVTDKFKTDIERILEPNKPAKIAIFGTGIAVLLTIAALAGVMQPAIAAPLGLLIGLAAMQKIMGK